MLPAHRVADWPNRADFRLQPEGRATREGPVPPASPSPRPLELKDSRGASKTEGVSFGRPRSRSLLLWETGVPLPDARQPPSRPPRTLQNPRQFDHPSRRPCPPLPLSPRDMPSAPRRPPRACASDVLLSAAILPLGPGATDNRGPPRNESPLAPLVRPWKIASQPSRDSGLTGRRISRDSRRTLALQSPQDRNTPGSRVSVHSCTTILVYRKRGSFAPSFSG
jgi:hypothetical protein